MSKTIKVDLEVYERLDRIRGKGETFSQVVERCLSVVEAWKGIWSKFDQPPYSKERPLADARAKETSYR